MYKNNLEIKLVFLFHKTKRCLVRIPYHGESSCILHMTVGDKFVCTAQASCKLCIQIPKLKRPAALVAVFCGAPQFNSKSSIPTVQVKKLIELSKNYYRGNDMSMLENINFYKLQPVILFEGDVHCIS